MNTETINIKIDAATKRRAQQVAKELGLSLSTILKGFLRQFIQTKKIEFSAAEEPSEYLLAMLKKSEEDIKRGDIITFENPSDALEHADRLIKMDEAKNTRRKN